VYRLLYNPASGAEADPPAVERELNGPDIAHIVAIVEAEVAKKYAPIFAESAAAKVRMQDLEARVEAITARVDWLNAPKVIPPK
jgi:hypothetical protein